MRSLLSLSSQQASCEGIAALADCDLLLSRSHPLVNRVASYKFDFHVLSINNGAHERDLPIGSDRSGEDGSRKGVDPAASRAALLHRGRYLLVLHQERRRRRIAGQLSRAVALDDRSGRALSAFGFSSSDRFFNTAGLRRHGTQDPERGALRLRAAAAQPAGLYRTSVLSERGRDSRT